MSLLSDSEGEQDDLNLLTINEHYAKAFEYKKERQELEKLKAKYGSDYEEDDISESDSESDESEDEDGEELTPAVDAAILRTLARIKRKDPEIYDSKTNIFQGAHMDWMLSEQQKLADVKPKTRLTKDKVRLHTPFLSVTHSPPVALENALDRGSRTPSPEPVTHVEEQRALRDETIAAFHTAVDSADDEDDLLIPREKTKDELEREEEEYRTFLEREVGEDLSHLVSVESAAGTSAAVEEAEEESPKKKKKKEKKKAEKGQEKGRKSKEEEDHEFLMNYILNRGWMDRESKRIPTYKEVTSSKKEKGKHRAEPNSSDSESDASDNENAKPTADPDIDESDFEEIVDRFESSYNFRFEEPDAATIKTYPRNIETTVRREENPRKEARERKKQRKEEELQRKREEVRRLKALKMKEIRAKLDRIGREGGKDLERDAALQELDLEADWDPEAHDRQMAGLYGDDFEGDEEKPTWDDDIDIGDIPMSDDDAQPASKKDKKKKKKKKKDEDEDMEADGVDIDAMDADAPPPDFDDEEWDGTEEMRKRKLDEYMNELYGLDFNDMVGGMPTRFRYVSVPKQDFSLTPAEILMATDKELNEYMSIKKYAPYKRDNKWDPKRPDKIRELRHKIGERTGGRMPFAAGGEGGQDGEKKKKRKGKSERKKAKAAAVEGDGQSAKKRKRKHKKKEVE
uniref:Kri1-like C-terminal domain-containing protein n=1 Tax=Schizophyllum commune (strain H4-8 / FGSC 9210) TaxID=578458 RepID=D8QA87_SCHCM